MKNKSVLFFLLVAGLIVTAWPAPSAKAGTLSIEPVASGVWAVIGEGGRANAGFILTRDGVVVIDSQINPRAAEAMLRAIRKLTDKPILYLINTHAHGDHTFADHVIRPTKGIIAHERTKSLLAHGGAKMLKDYPRVVGPKEAEGAKITLPTITFTDQMTLPIADRTIILRYLGIGHTVGDIVVWLPGDRVLFTGDLVVVNQLPWLGEGETREWLKTLARMKTLPYERIVPGSGPVGDRQSVDRFERYLSDLRRAVVEAFLKRQSLEQLKRTASFPEYSHDLHYREWLPLNLEHAYRQMEKER
jgi:glyoxylase-like metal-dependent hydrolase (beta-lactamase superfamily II)